MKRAMTASIGTKLSTWFHGKLVGRDAFGNRYFQAKRIRTGEKKPRRWVMYHGIVEASKVPANWHGWLHYTLDAPLPEAKQHGWQQPSQPNLTGTTGRFIPASHATLGDAHKEAITNYQPWTPE